MDLMAFRNQYVSQSGNIEYVNLLFSADAFLTVSRRGQLNFFTNSRKDVSDQIFIFFTEEKSVGVKTMRKYVVSAIPNHPNPLKSLSS